MKTYNEVKQLAKNPHYHLNSEERRILSEQQDLGALSPDYQEGTVYFEEPAFETLEPVQKNKNQVVRVTGDIKKHTTVAEE